MTKEPPPRGRPFIFARYFVASNPGNQTSAFAFQVALFPLDWTLIASRS